MYRSIDLAVVVAEVGYHCVVVAVHVVYLELFQAHIAGQTLEELALFSQRYVAAFEGQFLEGGVGVGHGEYFGAADADEFGIVAEIDGLVAEGSRRVDDILQTDQWELIFGQADHEHGVADLVHHVVHMVVLQIWLVNNQGSLHELSPKREYVF